MLRAVADGNQEGKEGEGRWEGAPEGVGEERKGSGGSGRKPECDVAGEGSGTGETDGLLDTVSGQNKRLFTNRWKSGRETGGEKEQAKGNPKHNTP